MSTPLFDQLVSTASPLSRHVVAPIANRRRRSIASALPAPASPVATPAAAVLTPAAVPAPAEPGLPTTEPLTVDELTADEREIVAEMGGTVARLIMRMLDDDTTSKRRWPFHEVR